MADAMPDALDHVDGAVAAVQRLHLRTMRALRRPIPPRSALHLATMCALRERETVVQMYVPVDYAKRVRENADALALTQVDLENLAGSTRHDEIEGSLTEATRQSLAHTAANPDVKRIIDLINAQLRNAMVDPLVARNWRTYSCRLAAVVAFALEDPIDALRVVIGPFAEADARRLLTHCNQFDESEVETSRLLDAVDAAARALSECIA